MVFTKILTVIKHYKFRISVFLTLTFFLSGIQSELAYLPKKTESPLYRVAVFTPTTEGNTYWPEVHRVMSAVAEDLNIELSFHEFDVRDRFEKPEKGVHLLQKKPVPDAAIFSVSFGQAKPLMEIAEKLRIPYFLNGPLFPAELKELGDTPRNKYSKWIGYFHEDEEQKGYILARELIEAAFRQNRIASDGTVHVVGLSGDPTWHGSFLREQGLKRAVDENPRVRLMQTVPTRWTPEEGRNLTIRLLKRYPEVSVVWAASDQLALGAVEALNSLGMEPGRTVFTGGLDLSLVGVQAVQEGDLTASVGSTPLIWARILICLYDYLRGIDFSDKTGTVFIFSPDLALKSSAEKFILRRDRYRKINFRDYSRFHMGKDAIYNYKSKPFK
ncbi:MAG: ABC transporter substrate-binding protein [Spirochaetes bacterium]|jgi:ABC-type sugar transport system substrate-binding protein|nr:ABC transporter substrate-binding protein [Spirochaetota bacterium]